MVVTLKGFWNTCYLFMLFDTLFAVIRASMNTIRGLATRWIGTRDTPYYISVTRGILFGGSPTTT